jgi:isochorismate pyruvate lyase
MTRSSLKSDVPPMEPVGKARAYPCANMSEVRREIDRVDRAIVDLIAERLAYIEQAGCIKANRDQVRDPARIEDVVAKVCAEARRHGIDERLIEDLYRLLIERSIAYEFQVYDQRRNKA